jgi:HNH endonuclease
VTARKALPRVLVSLAVLVVLYEAVAIFTDAVPTITEIVQALPGLAELVIIGPVIVWIAWHFGWLWPGDKPPVGYRVIEAAVRSGAEVRGAMGLDCAAHRHRELVPLERHHVWPKGEGGPDTPDNLVTLCSNAHSAAHDLLSKMLRTEGPVPWSIRRNYGRKVRAVADEGYRAIQRAQNSPSDRPG